MRIWDFSMCELKKRISSPAQVWWITSVDNLKRISSPVQVWWITGRSPLGHQGCGIVRHQNSWNLCPPDRRSSQAVTRDDPNVRGSGGVRFYLHRGRSSYVRQSPGLVVTSHQPLKLEGKYATLRQFWYTVAVTCYRCYSTLKGIGSTCDKRSHHAQSRTSK
jgi:hypothetical protein